MTRTLQLLEHDGMWASRFADESARLRAAVEASILAIEHVGSTAVPNLAGKPVLDIAIAVANGTLADACIRPLEALGYDYRGPHGDDTDRRYYVLDLDGRRTVQLHLYILPAPAWSEKLAFRNALRADPQLARSYASEKTRAATVVGWDKFAYSIEKGAFIQDTLRQLRAR